MRKCSMNEISERQKYILTLVIHEYIQTANPVASTPLVEGYNLTMSSATVRNEMAALTDLGYLRQPHTSAGRVPTEEGYRFFVSRLLNRMDLPESTRHTISHQFFQMQNDIEQSMKLAASVLASQSQAASLVTAPHADTARLKHLELIATRGSQVLMVLVLMGGEILQHVITLQEYVPQDQLSKMSDIITNMFQGKSVRQINNSLEGLEPLEKDIIQLVAHEMLNAQSTPAGDIYLDGVSNILSEPEFAGTGEARKAIRVLEERPILHDLLARTILNENIGGVQVLIGGEGSMEELRPFSVVLSKYGTPGLATGTLGVLGPMRMSYGRTISIIRFLSRVLSDLVTETLVE